MLLKEMNADVGHTIDIQKSTAHSVVTVSTDPCSEIATVVDVYC